MLVAVAAVVMRVVAQPQAVRVEAVTVEMQQHH
jgi:hypothetical protein